MEREQQWTLPDWERLGRTFAAARREKGLTQQQTADALGVSRAPVQAIERGRQSNGTDFTKVTRTMRDYARLVGWTEDSPELILQEQEPEPATQPVSATAAEPTSDLPPAIDLELRSGKTVDSMVVYLGDEDDDNRIIVVLKGKKDITDDEIDDLYQQWRRTRRQLQGITPDNDGVKDS